VKSAKTTAQISHAKTEQRVLMITFLLYVNVHLDSMELCVKTISTTVLETRLDSVKTMDSVLMESMQQRATVTILGKGFYFYFFLCPLLISFIFCF
jgi:hypothetical protein